MPALHILSTSATAVCRAAIKCSTQREDISHGVELYHPEVPLITAETAADTSPTGDPRRLHRGRAVKLVQCGNHHPPSWVTIKVGSCGVNALAIEETVDRREHMPARRVKRQPSSIFSDAEVSLHVDIWHHSVDC